MNWTAAKSGAQGCGWGSVEGPVPGSRALSPRASLHLTQRARRSWPQAGEGPVRAPGVRGKGNHPQALQAQRDHQAGLVRSGAKAAPDRGGSGAEQIHSMAESGAGFIRSTIRADCRRRARIASTGRHCCRWRGREAAAAPSGAKRRPLPSHEDGVGGREKLME